MPYSRSLLDTFSTVRCLSVTFAVLATNRVSRPPSRMYRFRHLLELVSLWFPRQRLQRRKPGVIWDAGSAKDITATNEWSTVSLSDIFCFFAANHLVSALDQVNVQRFISQVCISLTLWQRCTRSDLEGQHTNAIYVINGNSKNPSTIYVYDATANPGLPKLQRQSARCSATSSLFLFLR